MNREEWLRHAVEYIDSDVFGGDLDIINHKFQIACGRCPGKKLTECIQPSDNEDISLDDFFPTTIHVNFTISDPNEMIGNLALECINAFFNIKPRSGKLFKSIANKYLFDPPYSSYNPSPALMDIINNIYKKLVSRYGEFPGKPIKFPSKEDKPRAKNIYNIICPECNYELKVTKKMYDKYNGGLPVCACGAKMILEDNDEICEVKENEN